MGNIKRHNRSLPLHPQPHAEDMDFFEKIIKDEVKKTVHDELSHHPVHFSPETTSERAQRFHRAY
ncbi:MAG: hypothetical protein ABIS59_01765 [Candidatus Saccharibacteria bacterium]